MFHPCTKLNLKRDTMCTQRTSQHCVDTSDGDSYLQVLVKNFSVEQALTHEKSYFTM